MSLGDNFYPNGAESEDDERFTTKWRAVYNGDNIRDLVRNVLLQLFLVLWTYIMNTDKERHESFDLNKFIRTDRAG